MLSIAGFFYVAFTVFNVLIPGWARLSALRTEIAEREMARAEIEELITKARDFLARTGDLERRARPIYASLPVSPELPELVAILSAISSKNRIVLSQMRFETEEFRQESGVRAAGPTVSKIEVTANIVGRYPDLKNWLKDAEAELRLLDIQAMSFQPITGEQIASPDTPINVEVLLRAYWQQPIATAP